MPVGSPTSARPPYQRRALRRRAQFPAPGLTIHGGFRVELRRLVGRRQEQQGGQCDRAHYGCHAGDAVRGRRQLEPVWLTQTSRRPRPLWRRRRSQCRAVDPARPRVVRHAVGDRSLRSRSTRMGTNRPSSSGAKRGHQRRLTNHRHSYTAHLSHQRSTRSAACSRPSQRRQRQR